MVRFAIPLPPDEIVSPTGNSVRLFFPRDVSRRGRNNFMGEFVHYRQPGLLHEHNRRMLRPGHALEELADGFVIRSGRERVLDLE